MAKEIYYSFILFKMHTKIKVGKPGVGKSEEKRTLGRTRCRWVDNIEMNLRETAWGGMDWSDRAQDRDQWRELL
jgi:hypothetical protein